MDLKYPALVHWAMRASHPIVLHSACLQRPISALEANSKRLHAIILAPAVVAAYVRNAAQPQWQTGADIVESYGKAIEAVEGGITGVFFSVLTGTWTLFEVLATDVWTVTLNEHPR